MRKFTDDPQWMDQLLRDLQNFDNSPKDSVKTEPDEDHFSEYIIEIPDELDTKLCNLISDDSRGIDGSAMNFLKKNGFSIFPGEKDSFGWLTACIRFPKLNAIYVFG